MTIDEMEIVFAAVLRGCGYHHPMEAMGVCLELEKSFSRFKLSFYEEKIRDTETDEERMVPIIRLVTRPDPHTAGDDGSYVPPILG